MSDLIDRQAAIDAVKDELNPSIVKFVKAKIAIEKLPSAQPELIEQAAYVRGFEQGRIQGKIDAQPNLQPTCNNLATDCISRQAAIDVINALHEKPNAWLDSAMDAVMTLPSVQTEQRWIPCSEETGEGYPKEYGYYYVTEQNYGFYLDAVYKQRVTHTSYFGSGGFTDRFYVKNSSNITAWMPLPDPYGGKE